LTVETSTMNPFNIKTNHKKPDSLIFVTKQNWPNLGASDTKPSSSLLKLSLT
jgi:hypothetical protein